MIRCKMVIYSELRAISGLVFGTLFTGPFSYCFYFIILLLFALLGLNRAFPISPYFKATESVLKQKNPELFGIQGVKFANTSVYLVLNASTEVILPLRQWCHQESNRGHKDFQSFALPTELWHRKANSTQLFLFCGCKGS